MRSLWALGLVLLLAAPVAASEWGQIKPGETKQAAVRARYGAPTKETAQKVEGYDTAQWVYEGAQAPTGIEKMIVDFGLLAPSGYRKDVVRTFKLEPKPDIFNRRLVVDGWGAPGRIGKEGDLEFFLYQDGLLVYFDKDGAQATSMIFTLPQPLPPAETRPAQPPPQR